MEATQSGYVALDVAELGAACAGLVVNGCLLWSLKRRQNIPIALLNLTVSQSFVCVLSAAASSAALIGFAGWRTLAESLQVASPSLLGGHHLIKFVP